MLFKCRFCGSLADDGDIKGCVCLACIEDNPVCYVNQRYLDKMCLAEYEKLKKQMKEVK